MYPDDEVGVPSLVSRAPRVGFGARARSTEKHMSAAEAARLGDDIGHTSAMKGLLVGLVAGLAVGLLIVGSIATGGALAVALGAVFVAGMSATGGLIGMAIGQRNDGNIAGKIGSGSPNVLTVGRQQARAGVDFVECDHHGTKYIATGSSTVFVNCELAARRGDQTERDAKLHTDQETVLFGGETALAPGMNVTGEVPEWLVDTLTVVAWAGGIAGGLLMIPVIGVVGAALSFAGGYVGGIYGGKVGRWIGSHWGEEAAFWGELIGGATGGMLGGGAGAKTGIRIRPQTTYRLAAQPGSSRAQIAARREVLWREMRRPVNGQRMSRRDAASKVAGSDLRQPVRVRTLERDTQYQQYRNQGRDDYVGNWQAEAGTQLDEVGVGPWGYNRGAGELQPKEVITVTVPKGTRVVESTAAPIGDSWSAWTGGKKPQTAVQQTRGGGIQTYAHDNSGVHVTPGTGPPRPVVPNTPRPTLGKPPRTIIGPRQGGGLYLGTGVNPVGGMGGVPSGDGEP